MASPTSRRNRIGITQGALPLDESAPAEFVVENRRLTACVIGALSNTSMEEDAEMAKLFKEAKQVLTALGFEYVFSPECRTHPRDDCLPPDSVHEINLAEIENADALFFLAEHPATGAGKELAWGERSGAPTLILVSEGRVASRMVTGSSSDPVEMVWSTPTEFADQIREFFRRHKEQIFAHHEWRTARPRFFANSMETVSQIAYQYLRSPEDDALITVRRIREICLSIGHFENATLGEIARLYVASGRDPTEALPGTRSVGLDLKQLDALDGASKGWTLDRIQRVRRLAVEHLALPASRRSSLNHPSDWAQLDEQS
jgi:hypothetical protein